MSEVETMSEDDWRVARRIPLNAHFLCVLHRPTTEGGVDAPDGTASATSDGASPAERWTSWVCAVVEASALGCSAAGGGVGSSAGTGVGVVESSTEVVGLAMGLGESKRCISSSAVVAGVALTVGTAFKWGVNGKAGKTNEVIGHPTHY